jgi:hypothetical protein
VQNAAEEGSYAGNRTAQIGIPASGLVTRVGESFGEGHAKAGADRGRKSGNKGVMRAVGGECHGEDRRPLSPLDAIGVYLWVFWASL